MKRRGKVLNWLRSYFNGDPDARPDVHSTPSEEDHLTWNEALKNGHPGVVYVNSLSAPHHGTDSATDIIRALKSWNDQRSIKAVVRKGFRKILAGELSDDRPPRVAQFALLLIPKKNREHLIGDLEEEYRTIALPEFGRFWARLWYWEQTGLALGFYVWPFVKRILGLAAIWKVIGR